MDGAHPAALFEIQRSPPELADQFAGPRRVGFGRGREREMDG
jgi:hypothetical protein